MRCNTWCNSAATPPVIAGVALQHLPATPATALLLHCAPLLVEGAQQCNARHDNPKRLVGAHHSTETSAT